MPRVSNSDNVRAISKLVREKTLRSVVVLRDLCSNIEKVTFTFQRRIGSDEKCFMLTCGDCVLGGRLPRYILLIM